MPYERFRAWRACHELAVCTYHVTQSFPKTELYGLTSQMRRAASSAAANIAEGAAKKGSREFRRYLDIARGSLSELTYFGLLARDLELLSREQWETFNKSCDSAGKLTMAFYKAVSRSGVRKMDE